MLKTKVKKFVNYLRSHKVMITIVVLILLAIGWYFYKNNSENIKYQTVSVTKGSLSEIVSVTGSVKPLSDVNLSFELSGRLANINVSVGDKVRIGQALLSFENSDLLANINQANANLKHAQAQLDELKKGTRQEQLTLQYTKVNQATSDLAQARASLISTLNDSYTKADDSVRNKIDMMFTNPRTIIAKLIFQTDFQLKSDIEQERVMVETGLVAWNDLLKNLDESSDFNTYSQAAKKNLDLIKKLLENLGLAVNNLSINSGLSQTTIDTWKLNVSTARINVSTAINSLLAGVNQYNTSVSALRLSQDELALELAGATTEQLNAQEALVSQAKAQVDSSEAQFAKSIIKSPIDGVITNIDPKLGETVSAGKDVVSIISYGDYEVEAFIPEADIAKVKIGNTASTTLDAYGSNVNFETTVIKIDPAATVIDGVPTYKVTLKFTNQDERVKSGMTANLDILTNQKNDILILPARVITTQTDGKYVSYTNPADPTELLSKKIITGLRGSDGNIEVVSGLNEGDKVVVNQ